ncbi:MAG: methylenetetrahydrofolate reductase [Thermodesulfobacteriota bacterium]
METLKARLQKKQFVVTAEIQPPIGTGVEEVLRNIERVRGRVDGFIVPEFQIEGMVSDSLGTCTVLKENRYDPILQTATRKRNRLEIQSHLLSAAEAGIENVLTFTEDYRITGDSLQELMFFHVDSGKLFSVIENLREGHDISGREIGMEPDFCIGSGVDSGWGKKVPDLELKEMEQMVNLGTHYFLSTPVFNLDVFGKFLKSIESFQVPVIAEVILVRSPSMAHFINRYVKPNLVPNHIIEKLARAPDKEKASREIFAELIMGLKDLCQGIHIIPIGAEDRMQKYLDAAKLR